MQSIKTQITPVGSAKHLPTQPKFEAKEGIRAATPIVEPKNVEGHADSPKAQMPEPRPEIKLVSAEVLPTPKKITKPDLQVAAEMGKVELVKLLLEEINSDPSITDSLGNTTVMGVLCAIDQGDESSTAHARIECLKTLIPYCSSETLDKANSAGKSPLRLLIKLSIPSKDKCELIDLLAAQGVNLNKKYKIETDPSRPGTILDELIFHALQEEDKETFEKDYFPVIQKLINLKVSYDESFFMEEPLEKVGSARTMTIPLRRLYRLNQIRVNDLAFGDDSSSDEAFSDTASVDDASEKSQDDSIGGCILM